MTAGRILGAWALISVASMLITWTFPRTWTGLLLTLTVLPAVHLVLDVTLGAVHGSGPVARFHAGLERRTQAQRTSALRIFVFLVELLVLGGVAIGLCFVLAQATGTDMAAVNAFLQRHFWP